MRAGAEGAAADAQRLPEVPPGSIARVVEIDASVSDWRERLQAYGLAPGRELEVVQHAPVTVVRVDHIDLAFEARIARGIVVSEATEGLGQGPVSKPPRPPGVSPG